MRSRFFIIITAISISIACLDSLAYPLTENTTIPSKNAANNQFPPLVAYNEELYLLAYQTFSANGEPKRALNVALAANKARPHDIDWQRRVANIAAWAGRPKLAMDEFFTLAQKTQSPEDLEKVIQLASAYYNDPLLIKALNIKLANNPNDMDSRRKWVRAMEREGEARSAAVTLKKLIQQGGKHEKFYLTELARLYLRLGNTQQEMAIIKILQSKYTPTANRALRQAEIYYNQGKITPAIKVLMAVAEHIPSSEINYWQVLANLAWLADDHETALIAYQTLYQAGLASPGEIRNMIAIINEEHPKQAFSIGATALMQSNDPALFLQLAVITERLGNWDGLAALLNQLGPRQIKQLEKIDYFWQLRPYIWQKAGEDEKAIAAYQQALQQFPDNQALQAAYLWMLMDADKNHLLQQQVTRLSRQKNLSTHLENAYASAAIQSGLPQLAVTVYQRQFATRSDNIKFLTHYAYALQKANMSMLANKVRQHTWQLLYQKPKPLSDDELRTTASLAAEYGLVDQAIKILAQLISQYQLPEDMNVLLSWALSNREYDLAIYLRNFYYNKKNFPHYAAMALALVENNRNEMSKQLTYSIHHHKTPSSDDIIAAERLGHIKLARRLAFQRVNANPASYHDMEELKRLLLMTANVFTINQEYERVDSIEGPASTAQLYLFINSHWQVNGRLSTWLIDHKEKTTFAETPSHDSTAEINLEYQFNPGYPTQRGFIQGSLGYRSAWQEFPFAELHISYPWNQRSTLSMELGINQTAEESSALRIAGAKDIIALTGNYQFTSRNLFIATLDGEHFYNQSRHYLGSGTNTSLNWQYLYRQRYPDVIFSPFFAAKFYNADGSIADVDQPLMNEDEEGNTANTGSAQRVGNTGTGIHFFIPYDLLQWGLTVSLGQSHYIPFNPSGSLGESQRTPYKRRWRPFLNSSIFQDYSQHKAKLGYAFSGGAAGGLFGHDNLSFYFDYSFGEEGIDFKFYLIGLQYKYYF